jgi:seryl-tRNA synthetase
VGTFLKNLQQFLTFAFQKQTNMLQVHFIRENKEEVITRLAKKNFEATAIVELIVELDEKRRNTQVELDNLLAESNKLSKDIGEMMKNGEKAKAEILKEKTTQFECNFKSIARRII